MGQVRGEHRAEIWAAALKGEGRTGQRRSQRARQRDSEGMGPESLAHAGRAPCRPSGASGTRGDEPQRPGRLRAGLGLGVDRGLEEGEGQGGANVSV